MRLILASVFVFLSLYACSSISDLSSNQRSISASDQNHFKDAFEINQILGKGMNLGNALEAPVEGDWGMVIQEEYLDLIADAGFESVRIPIQWNAHAQPYPPYTVNTSIFDRVDQVIKWSLDRDLAVIMNIQHYTELMANPNEHLERFFIHLGAVSISLQELSGNGCI